MRKVALGAIVAAFCIATSPAGASSWMTLQRLHARECAALQHVADREHGTTLGCHVYGKRELEARAKIDVPLTLALPLSGYTEQTFAASWIPHYGIYWTAVSALSVRLFSDQPL